MSVEETRAGVGGDELDVGKSLTFGGGLSAAAGWWSSAAAVAGGVNVKKSFASWHFVVFS